MHGCKALVQSGIVLLLWVSCLLLVFVTCSTLLSMMGSIHWIMSKGLGFNEQYFSKQLPIVEENFIFLLMGT